MLDDKELKKLIGYKVGKFSGEELTEEDLLSVKDIGISGKRLDGEEIAINIEELKKLSNLEILSINQMELNNETIDFLGTLPRLKSLMFTKCSIKPNTVVSLKNINNLIINGCTIEDHVLFFLPEDATIAEEDIDLENVFGKDRLRRLVLAGCKVPSLKPLLKCDSLEKVSIEGTSIEDNSIEEIKGKVEVSEKEESNPIR